MAEKNLRLRVVLDLADKALAPLKRISQGSQETAATLKAARDQLKQLQATQKDVASFRTMRTGLGDTETKLKAAREQVRQLAASHAQAGPPTKQMTAAMKAARNEAAQLGAKFKDQQQTVQRLRDKLAAAGIKTRDLASNEKQLRDSIANTTAKIENQTAALKRQSDMQRRAAGIKQVQSANVAARGNARGALLDGVALAATLGAPIKMAMEWEQRLAELNKVANKTPQELGAIASAAQKLAVETGVAREEIIGAYIAASQAGFAESEWAQFAEVSAKMGVAFDTTGDKAGDMLKAWRSGMNLSMDQAALLAGAVNHIANSMNATANDIGGVMQRQGAYLSAMGLSQTQSAALAATMLSGGATEEIASTASKNFMKAMTVGFAATKSQLKVFDMLDVDPEKLAKQMQKAPEKAIVDVMKRLQKLAPDQLAPAMKMLFGDESIGPAAQIVKSVDGLVAAFGVVGDTSKYANSLQAEFDSMGNTTQQQMKKASEGVKTVTTVLGMGLLPAVNSTMASLAPMALQLSNWMQANQGTVTTIVSIVAALIAFKIAAIAGAYAFTFVRGAVLSVQAALMAARMGWMLYTGAIVASTATSKAAIVLSKGLAAAQWLVNAAMSANPIGLLIIAIAGLIVAGAMLWRNWEQVVAGATALWSDFSTWFIGLLSGLGNWVAGIWSRVASAAGTALNTFVAGVKRVLDGGVGAWITALLNFSPLGILWNTFTTALAALGVQVPEQFRNFGSFIMDGLIGGITGKLAALKDSVVGAATSAASWFKEKLGIASPSKVFTQFGGWISEGAANGIAAGQAGVRAAALAMAGAAAAPVGAMDAGGAISSGPALAPRASVSAPAAPSSYAITIHAAPGMDANAIARAVAAELDKRERQRDSRGRSALHDTN